MQYEYKKNAEYDADFEYGEKVQKDSCKKVLSKKVTENWSSWLYVLESHFTSISGLVGSILSKQVKIVVA